MSLRVYILCLLFLQLVFLFHVLLHSHPDVIIIIDPVQPNLRLFEYTTGSDEIMEKNEMTTNTMDVYRENVSIYVLQSEHTGGFGVQGVRKENREILHIFVDY